MLHGWIMGTCGEKRYGINSYHSHCQIHVMKLKNLFICSYDSYIITVTNNTQITECHIASRMKTYRKCFDGFITL